MLLDAAAFAPTNRLDLSVYKPDFVPLSFYKIFGYPTGLGALIARCDRLHKLRRPWFAGGTITVASVQGDKYYLAEGHAAFEDGTVDYLNIPAIEIGLRHIESIGIEAIKERVRCLTGWLLDNLTAMQHSSGVSLVRVYGPTDTEARGGAVTVNFFDAQDRALITAPSKPPPTARISRCAPAASGTPAPAKSPWAPRRELTCASTALAMSSA